MSDADLTRAASTVTDFVAALGAGDIAAAGAKVGPISEQRANAAGGLEALLQESSEGHGAWATSADRTVTPIGIEAGVVAVVLSGTLQVEGNTEHRVEVFPVRKAESADAWFVERWAYDVASGPPMTIVSPAVDDQEYAAFDQGAPLTVTVQAAAAGTVFVSFDGKPPQAVTASGAGPVTVTSPSAGVSSAVVVFSSGPTLAASGFVAGPPGSSADRPHVPADYARAAFTAWQQGDLRRLRQLATDRAYQALAQRPTKPDDGWPGSPTCEGAAGSTYCQWSGAKQNLILRVGNQAVADGQVALTEVRFESP